MENLLNLECLKTKNLPPYIELQSESTWRVTIGKHLASGVNSNNLFWWLPSTANRTQLMG